METSQLANQLWNQLAAARQQAEAEWQDQASEEFAKQYWDSLEQLSAELIQILTEFEGYLQEINRHSEYV